MEVVEGFLDFHGANVHLHEMKQDLLINFVFFYLKDKVPSVSFASGLHTQSLCQALEPTLQQGTARLDSRSEGRRPDTHVSGELPLLFPC